MNYLCCDNEQEKCQESRRSRGWQGQGSPWGDGRFYSRPIWDGAGPAKKRWPWKNQAGMGEILPKPSRIARAQATMPRPEIVLENDDDAIPVGAGIGDDIDEFDAE